MSKPFRLIIAGGRHYNDYKSVKKACDYLLKNQPDVEIVSGGAKGADALGERYAKNHNLPCTIFKADWDNKGRAAGILRNIEMSDYAHALLAFWDGKSVGTKHMIEEADRKNLKVRIRKYD